MTTLDTMLDECGLTDELTDSDVAMLRTVTGPLEHLLGDAPAPSAALEEAVAQRIPLAIARTRRRGRRVAVASAAAIVAVVASTGIAAANNKLPAPLQREIAEFSRHHLPFEFPAPQQQSPQPVQPTPTADDDDRFDDHGGEVDRDDRVEPGDDRNTRDDDRSDNSGSDSSGSDNSGHGSDD
ncbi:MAG TPA: hypothetical protein VFO98_13505 [Marmoricola sp.]|nr:hypothetical protein [Marmoricola sp.]